MSDIIWVEKYRPRSLSDVVGQEQIVSRLKIFVENKNLPHLIFSAVMTIVTVPCRGRSRTALLPARTFGITLRC